MQEVDKETLRELSELTQNQALQSADKTEMDRLINIKLQCVTKAP